MHHLSDIFTENIRLKFEQFPLPHPNTPSVFPSISISCLYLAILLFLSPTLSPEPPQADMSILALAVLLYQPVSPNLFPLLPICYYKYACHNLDMNL